MISNIKQRNLNWLMMIMFLPLFLSFSLPLLFYSFPITYRFFNQDIKLASGDILYATMVWVAWICIAVITPLLLSRIKNSIGSERPWSLGTIWRGFIVLAVVGVLISPLQYFFTFNSGIEQLLQQLSFAPVVAVVVGIRAMQYINFTEGRQRLLMQHCGVLLLGLNSVIAIVLPVFMGKASPTVYAGLAILYGVHALKIGKKKQIAIWLVFVMVAGLAIAFKNSFRTNSFGSLFWYQGEYIRIPITDVMNLGIQEAYKIAWKKKEDAYILRAHKEEQRILQTDGIIFDAEKSFSLGDDASSNSYANKPLSADDYYYLNPSEYYKQDPNYNNIRFFSPDDNIPDKFKYLVAKSISRINHLGDLANAIRTTPDSIPYLYGSTYYPLLFKPIPRLFWKDKPEDNSGQVYGHRYGVLHSTDKTTSANMGVVIEAWINGGWTVLVLSAFAFGILIYLVWRYLIGESGEIGNIVLGTVLVASGLATESSMNLVMGGMLYSILVWWVMEHIIRTKL